MSEEQRTDQEVQELRERLVRGYEELAEKARETLDELGDQAEDAIEQAVERAQEWLDKAGKYTREELDELSEFLKRDLAATEDDLRRLVERAKTELHPSRLNAGFLSLAAKVTEKASGALEQLASRLDEARTYRTGQVTGPGTLVCVNCGEELRMKDTGHIPPCPKCRGTEFRKRW